MLNIDQSLRLDHLRFPLIVGVVFIHAYETTVSFAFGTVGTTQSALLADFVRNFISQEVARLAVPLFFLMSGYFFFAGFIFSMRAYFSKLKGRTKSLLIPYLFWNIGTLLLIAFAQAIPATQVYFSGRNTPVANFHAYDYLSAIFGIGRAPISYQFWFIRDLMLLVVFSPIIYWLIKVFPFFFMVAVFACWFFDSPFIFAPSAEATLFFAFGSFMALKNNDLFALDNYHKGILVAYVMTAGAGAMMFHAGPAEYAYLHKIGIVLGIPTVFSLTKKVADSKFLNAALISLSGASFFVYAAHEPLLTIARKIAYEAFKPDSTFLILVLYFAVPIIVITSLVLIYRVLSYFLPTIVSVITGRPTPAHSR